jgi:hypothetical protein
LSSHDTTEFSYQRENIGLLHKPRLGPNARWRKENPICGLSMHSSLALATSGLPLGLAAIRFWTRNKFKGTEGKRPADGFQLPTSSLLSAAPRVRPVR